MPRRQPPRPSPWLTFAMPLALSALSAAATWGATRQDNEHTRELASRLERRVDALESRVGASDVALATLQADIKTIKEDLGEIKRLLRPRIPLTGTSP